MTEMIVPHVGALQSLSISLLLIKEQLGLYYASIRPQLGLATPFSNPRQVSNPQQAIEDK